MTDSLKGLLSLTLQDYERKRIIKKELEQKIGNSMAYQKNARLFQDQSTARTDYTATLGSEYINYLETDSLISYTLKINPTEEDGSIYNLIFKEVISTNEIESYVIKYQPDVDWQPHEPFRGHVSFLPEDYFTINPTARGGGLYPCVYEGSPIWQCSAKNNHSPKDHENGTCSVGGNQIVGWDFNVVEWCTSSPMQYMDMSLQDPNPITSGGGGGSYYRYQTDCSTTGSSSSTSPTDSNNTTGANADTGLTDGGNVPTTPNFNIHDRVFNQLNLTDAQEYMLNAHPHLISFISSHLLQNPGNIDFMQYMIGYLDALSLYNENEYENILCGGGLNDGFLEDLEEDFENDMLKTKIDPSLNNTDIKCVLEKMIEDENDANGEPNLFKKMLLPFGDEETPNLTFRRGTLQFGNYALTTGDNDDNYEITFDTNFSDNAPNLVIQITIIHEAIHAFMYNDLKNWGLIYFDDYGNPTLIQEFEDNCYDGTYPVGQNLNTLSNKERIAVTICNFIIAWTNYEHDYTDWVHHLFNEPTFSFEIYRNKLTEYIVNFYDWNSESEEWRTKMEMKFGEDWKTNVVEIIVMDGLSDTIYFSDWLTSNDYVNEENPQHDNFNQENNYPQLINYVKFGAYTFENTILRPLNNECE